MYSVVSLKVGYPNENAYISCLLHGKVGISIKLNLVQLPGVSIGKISDDLATEFTFISTKMQIYGALTFSANISVPLPSRTPKAQTEYASDPDIIFKTNTRVFPPEI